MKNLKQNKGITLIALVITIIVMLILVAVTITIAVNGGLFNYARKAGVDTNTKIAEEQEYANLGNYEDYGYSKDYEYLIDKYTQVIHFKIYNTGAGTGPEYIYEFSAKKGMSWKEWVESDFPKMNEKYGKDPIGTFYIDEDDNSIYNMGAGSVISEDDESALESNEEIKDGVTYYLS